MDRLTLKAEERTIFGKKVKRLRKDGKLPGHVYGKKVETEHVTVGAKEFIKTFAQAGETGVIDLKIGSEKVRPVMVRGLDYNPVQGEITHIDFYQVNLSEKVKVPVPIELIGEEPESVHLGETIVLQTLNEIEVEALPNDLIEKIVVDISPLKQIEDAITVGQLNYDHSKLTVLANPEEVVVKLAPAVSAEMQELLEEEAAEQAATEEAATEGEEVKEGEETKEGEESAPEGQTRVGEGESKTEEPSEPAQ